MKDRHAYCIMAHKNWTQLQMLVSILDDPRNDIFLHIDKKAKAEFDKWGGKLMFVIPKFIMWKALM